MIARRMLRQDGPTRVYLAANYSRAEEMRGYRTVLEAVGYEVTSRWIDHHGGMQGPTSIGPEQLNAADSLEDLELARKCAQNDIQDLLRADAMLFYTNGNGRSKGGRHTELGIAMSCGKGITIIGPMENVFHTLPYFDHYPGWDEFLVAIKEANRAASQARTEAGESAERTPV